MPHKLSPFLPGGETRQPSEAVPSPLPPACAGYYVVLAAGASSRMGSPKALLPLAGKALILHHVETALAHGLQPLVVLGHHAEQILAQEPTVGPLHCLNTAPERGQFSSLQTALHVIFTQQPGSLDTRHPASQENPDPTQYPPEPRAHRPPRTAWEALPLFLTPVDCPPASPSVFQTLLAVWHEQLQSRFQETVPRPAAPPGADLPTLVPTHNARPGHPIVLPVQRIPALLEAPVDGALDRLLPAFPLVSVPVESAAILLNLNTPADFQAFSMTR